MSQRLTTPFPSLFLSSASIERLKAIYSRFDEAGSRAIMDEWAEANDTLTGDKWTDFDSVYTAFYVITLLGEKRIPPKDDRGTSVEFLLDVSLDNPEHPQRLISEETVSDLITCRNIIQRVSPLPLRMRYVGTGCVFYRFGVSSALNGVEAIGIRDAERLKRFFNRDNSAWSTTANRYAIVDCVVRP
jgi:hypothetical protein